MLKTALFFTLYGLPVIPPLAAAFTFVMIVAGRRIAGRTGMKVAAFGSAIIPALPLAAFVAALIRYRTLDGPHYPDQVMGVLLFGSLGVNAILGFGAGILLCWRDQWARARAAEERHRSR